MLSPPQGFPPVKPQLRESQEQLRFQLLAAFWWEPWAQRRAAEVLPATVIRISSRDWKCSQP